MTTVSMNRRFWRRAIVGLTAAVTPVVGIAAAPAHAVPTSAALVAVGAATHALGNHVNQAQIVGPDPAPRVVQQEGGYLVGASPNFIGVIPSSGVCSWDFNVFGAQPGIVHSVLTCQGPLGPTYALVGTNPAVGCNDLRVCAFLEASECRRGARHRWRVACSSPLGRTGAEERSRK
jgi:hypothetical protein